MKLLLVRHGETEWNAKKIVMGWKNSPLTELGLAQAKIAAQELSEKPIDLIITSDLGRAKQTAEIIAKQTGVDILKSWLIRERCNGEIDGMHKSDFDREHVNANPEEYNAESFNEMTERADAFVQSLKHLPIKAENIVIVAHNGILNSLIALIDKNHERRRIENAEIIELEI